jgi:hypothetical protein
MQKIRAVLAASVLVGAVLPAHASDVTVGVNSWYTPPNLSQEDMVKQLAANGVKTFRISLFPNSIDFVIKAYQHGIGALVIVYPHMGSTARQKRSWADVPLSGLKPQEFIAALRPMLDKLEAAGVRLSAIELGNEINTSGYNGDVATPGSGRVLGLRDLDNASDAEARPIAAGFRVYVTIMAALRDLRDQSKLNQRTPIIAAGMADWGPAAATGWSKQLGVNLSDTITFLRQRGLDRVADGYGVHVYPGLDPNRSVATRIASLEQTIFAACTKAKPCWLTEWGVPDGSPGGAPDRCPVDETKRLKVIEQLRAAFQHFVSEGRLAAIIFYDWADKPGNTGAIFRCGALTAAGKLALSPM